ncbi:glycoside hydrolase family 127 protein [Spirosoma fluminis]
MESLNSMKNNGLYLALTSLLLAAGSAEAQRGIRPVNFSQVTISDQFWRPRIERVQTATLPVCIEQTEGKTARIRNFEKAAARSGKHEGIYFDDSDVYKVIEGMAYTLKTNRNAALEQKADEWIDKIASAQLPDGYLNTYYTLGDLSKRWTDMEKHEDYNAGHLFEAAVAYYDATGKRKLLDVATRFANHIDSTFRLANRPWVSGHQEIELALVKLYHATHNDRYLKLADWYLEQRGKGFGKGAIWDNKAWGPRYCQDDVPVRQITDIKGHAVRAMYLYTGMADVAAETGDRGYMEATGRVWDDVVGRNMYITGGIGSSVHNEGFTEDYDLPNESAYCETCASVGMVLWNQRMNLYSGDARYIDVLERSLYNAALAGVQLSGELFFYVNPLASPGNHHRKPWYGTACCPSNVSRLLPSLGGYVYNTSKDALWVNLYVSSETTAQINRHPVQISQQSNYPWDGTIKLTINPDKAANFDVKMRIPGWCKKYTATLNGQAVNANVDKGYLVVNRKWKKGDVVTLTLDMPIDVVAADPRVKADAGKRAVQRGPLVYCLEEADTKGAAFDQATLSAQTTFVMQNRPDLLDGITAIQARNQAGTYTLIPYYAWDNRQPGRMKVWLDWK